MNEAVAHVYSRMTKRSLRLQICTRAREWNHVRLFACQEVLICVHSPDEEVSLYRPVVDNDETVLYYISGVLHFAFDLSSTS